MLVREPDALCADGPSEIVDGRTPSTPRGCTAQAWGVAEVLRVLQDLLFAPIAAL